MIVSDKPASIEKANDVSAKIVALILKETSDFFSEDDPAEIIYLACHILGSLLAKMCISMESYGNIYAIENLTNEYIKEWINTIADEHIKLNKEGN